MHGGGVLLPVTAHLFSSWTALDPISLLAVGEFHKLDTPHMPQLQCTCSGREEVAEHIHSHHKMVARNMARAIDSRNQLSTTKMQQINTKY